MTGPVAVGGEYTEREALIDVDIIARVTLLALHSGSPQRGSRQAFEQPSSFTPLPSSHCSAMVPKNSTLLSISKPEQSDEKSENGDSMRVYSEHSQLNAWWI